MGLPRRLFASLSFAAFVLGFIVVAEPARAQVRVAIIGDSNVYGKGISSSENYPSQLEAALKARGFNVSISNGGINGDTSAGLAGAPGLGCSCRYAGCGDLDRDQRRSPRRQSRGGSGECRGHCKPSAGQGHRELFHPASGLQRRGSQESGVDPSGRSPFNAAGYSRMVAKTIGPVQSLVAKAAKKKAA